MALSSLRCFNSPCLRSALRPWAARPPTAGHASVVRLPENSSGCPAWRLRPVAQRSAGPASGAGYLAMRLQRRRSRDSSNSVGGCCLASVLKPVVWLLLCDAGPEPASLFAVRPVSQGPAHAVPAPRTMTEQPARISRFMFMRISFFFFLLSRAPTEQEVKETHAMVCGVSILMIEGLPSAGGRSASDIEMLHPFSTSRRLPGFSLMPRERKITVGEMLSNLGCRP